MSFPGPDAAEQGRNWVRYEQAVGQFRGVVVQSSEVGFALGVIGEKTIRLGGDLGDNDKAWVRICSTLPPGTPDDSGASAAVDFVVKPGEHRVVRFVLAWHTREWQSEFPYGLKLSKYTNHYTETYPSAVDAARKIAENHETLLREFSPGSRLFTQRVICPLAPRSARQYIAFGYGGKLLGNRQAALG